MKVPWTPREDEVITSLYGTMSYDVISNLLGSRTWSAVRNRASYIGLCSSSNLGRKYCVNKQYFDAPNIGNSYWAGFIAADGNIRADRKRLSLKLAEKDREHLEAFKSAIKYTGPVLKNCELQIASPDLVHGLEANYNITPQKTHTLQPPLLSSTEERLSFIKGLIDGDGWINEHRPGSVRISVCGNPQMMEWVRIVVEELLPRQSYKNSSVVHCKDRHLSIYSVSGKRATQLFSLIHDLQTFGLYRKWKCFTKESVV